MHLSQIIILFAVILPLCFCHCTCFSLFKIIINGIVVAAYRCEGCAMKPIEGPRFHCQVCADFDFCQDCFIRGQSHNHAFERVDDQGYPAVYVGSPRSCRMALRKKKKVHVLIIFSRQSIGGRN